MLLQDQLGTSGSAAQGGQVSLHMGGLLPIWFVLCCLCPACLGGQIILIRADDLGLAGLAGKEQAGSLGTGSSQEYKNEEPGLCWQPGKHWCLLELAERALAPPASRQSCEMGAHTTRKSRTPFSPLF